jgi:phosphatidylglycerol lysyltransferase
MRDRLIRALPAVIGLALFAAALAVLNRELQTVTWHELTRDIGNTPVLRLSVALLLTVLNYSTVTAYDFLAFAYIRKHLPRERIALASFLAYAIANNVGFATLSGASVRYRFYTRWGVTAKELSRVMVAYITTFWLGLLLLAGISLLVSRLPQALAMPRVVAIPIGLVLVLVSIAYVVLPFVRTGSIRLRGFVLPLPTPRLALAQLLVSAIDWILAAAVLFVLLPPTGLRFVGFLGAFVLAQLLGLASHVPGGIGVFEGTIVLTLRQFMDAGDVLPALIVYRAVYYLLPLTIALIVLVIDELHQRRHQAARMSELLGRVTAQLTPPLLAMFTFLSGVVLLYSGATPASTGRLLWLDRIFPLGVIEASHFVSSVLGAALLLLSQGLARRLDAAYVLTAMVMALGIGTTLLKGVDYEEAVILAAVLLILWRARPAFDRRAAFFDTRFSIGWTLAVVAALGSSIWLGAFTFRHVDYSNELWWEFELHGEASRFLRGSVGAAVVLLLFAFARLIRHAPPEMHAPTDEELADASRIIAAQTATYPQLVYLRDKTVMFDDERRGFVMYGVQGRTWVALGDPVGPPECWSGLIRAFLERCDDYGGMPVFYEVSKAHLHRYADFGLTFVKLGEEARIDLTQFSLEGSRASRHRQAVRYIEKAGATFRVVEPADVPAIIDRLRVVSDAWLREKSVGEKGFSLGSFQPDYLARFPVGVVEKDGEIYAFANIWLSPCHAELAIDLMRFREGAPREVMEGVLVSVMSWGKAQGYRWFSLGMAPLSGFERSPMAPLWNRIGSFLFEHGGSFYNFQGLRAYKDKFHPHWEPRYLVYPGGFRLPQILADISALVAGGYHKILLKSP